VCRSPAVLKPGLPGDGVAKGLWTVLMMSGTGRALRQHLRDADEATAAWTRLPIRNVVNPRIGCRAKQTCGTQMEKAVEARRNGKGGTSRGRGRQRPKAKGEAFARRPAAGSGHLVCVSMEGWSLRTPREEVRRGRSDSRSRARRADPDLQTRAALIAMRLRRRGEGHEG
jgi:hypothetical protein